MARIRLRGTAAIVLVACACHACDSTTQTQDAGIDAPVAVLRIVSEQAPVLTCNEIDWCFDVRQDGSHRAAGLSAAAFTYSLTDPSTGMTTPASNTCFSEVVGDGGLACYRLCLGSDLVSDHGYVLGVVVAVDGGTVSESSYFRTAPPPDGDLAESGCMVPPGNDAAADATMADAPTDAPTDALGADAVDASDAPLPLDVLTLDASLGID